jgi:hypothetical protein
MGTAEFLGVADSYTITAANGVGTTDATANSTTNQLGRVNIDYIEDVNIVSTGAFGFVDNTIIVGATRAKTVTIIGDQDISLTTSGMGNATAPSVANGLGVSAIDATGLAGDLTLDTNGVSMNVFGLTISSGAGDDVITLSGTGTEIETVLAGAGNDRINTTAIASTLSGEAGKDTFNVTAAVAFANAAATDVVTTIKDFTAGDVIDFIGATNGAHAATANAVAQLTLTTETTLSAAVKNAVDLSPGAAADAAWFYWGGNTYVVFDAVDDAGANGGLAANDVVVKLTGQIDLTGAGLDVTDGSFVLA